MTRRDHEKRLDMVSKLLTQATSVAGTPEADAFTHRALMLISQVGIDLARDAAAAGRTDDTIVRHDVEIEGDFLHQRITLLCRIASALHCAHAYWLFSDTAASVEIFGMQHHIDRVHILYAPLLQRMLQQATTAPPAPSNGQSLREHQMSWMHGFTLSVREQLRAAEVTAAIAADHRTGIHTEQHTRDTERATAEKARQRPKVRPSTYEPALGLDSIVDGLRAGTGSDQPDRR